MSIGPSASLLDLKDLITGESSWVRTSASDINDADQIVGQGMGGGKVSVMEVDV
jgi:hypothetical protein